MIEKMGYISDGISMTYMILITILDISLLSIQNPLKR